MSPRKRTPTVHRVWSEDYVLWVVVTRTDDVDAARAAALAEAELDVRGGILDLDEYREEGEPTEQERAIALLKQAPTRTGWGRFQVGLHDDGEAGGRFWHHDRAEGERGVTQYVEWQLEVDW